MDRPPRPLPPDGEDRPPLHRWLWFGAAWGFVGLGVLGVALPVLPSFPFLLLALWAFSRSSARFHHWLYHHPVLGPPLQRWRRERVVPLRVKAIAAASMLGSLAWLAFGARAPWYVLAATGVLVAASLGFLASVPSRPSRPDAPEAGG